MPQLILLPGLAGDEVMWRGQLAGLHAHRPVVTDVHMRESSIEAMARTLLTENAGPLALCGASMGGMIAMEAARQAPERIAGLALLGTTARPESDEMRELRLNAIELFEQGRVAEVIAPNVRFAFHAENAGNPEITEAYLEFVLRAGTKQLIAQNRAVIARPDARLHLPRVRSRTVVLCGEADQLTPPENSSEIASLVPASELLMIPRCGHMLTMEQPQAVNAALLRWLETL